MAEVYLGSFGGRIPFDSFEWSGASENAALETWASTEYRTVTVDDSGPTTLLKWDRYKDDFINGKIYYDSGQAELNDGDYVLIKTTLGTPPPEPQVSAIPAGTWRSDEYGRPYDLNDLLA